MARKPLDLDASPATLITTMAEGDDTAGQVVTRLVFGGGADGVFTLLHLDDMNIRGPQITQAFNNFAGGDLAKLAEAAENRDPALVDSINAAFKAGDYK